MAGTVMSRVGVRDARTLALGIQMNATLIGSRSLVIAQLDVARVHRAWERLYKDWGHGIRGYADVVWFEVKKKSQPKLRVLRGGGACLHTATPTY